ncbi:hypothetical protein OBBRIDRAFT_807466 [Obba rivulosa]|uniref:Uncharacterized protein n=1 Tax=Obba rivulosa TaxID=1052685 RepID=A0A8E2AJ50_9APHY|nr:hypothetical protein OBBRIDRAFT_807466 [Obba rivulosa]
MQHRTTPIQGARRELRARRGIPNCTSDAETLWTPCQTGPQPLSIVSKGHGRIPLMMWTEQSNATQCAARNVRELGSGDARANRTVQVCPRCGGTGADRIQDYDVPPKLPPITLGCAPRIREPRSRLAARTRRVAPAARVQDSCISAGPACVCFCCRTESEVLSARPGLTLAVRVPARGPNGPGVPSLRGYTRRIRVSLLVG